MLNFPGKRAEGGELLYLNRQVRRKRLQSAADSTSSDAERVAGQVITLRIDFVAKPEHKNEIASHVGNLLAEAGLHQKGLQASVLLVSDREVRVATLLTLWDADRFNLERERLTSWTLRLMTGLSDGPIKANTSVAHFLLPKESTKLTLSDLRPAEIAELVEIVAAG